MAASPSAPAGDLTVTSPSVIPRPEAADEALVEEDLVIEEISIDGMCGVY